MGQITNPIVKGITVLPVDRQSGPAAGAGATGNNSIFLGANAGLNSTISNFIAIGHNAAPHGVVDPSLNGSTVVGVNTLQALTAGGAFGFPLTVIGSNNANALPAIGSTVIVGNSIVNAMPTGLDASVYVGNNLYNASTANVTPSQSVIVGFNIAGTIAGNSKATQSTIIGTSILSGSGPQVTQGSVLIGNAIQTNSAAAGQINETVAIGQTISIPVGSQSNVIIGGGSGSVDAGINENSIVAIGQGSMFSDGGGFHVLLGFNTISPRGAGATFGCVCIGANAGTSVPSAAANTNLLVIESSTAVGGGTGNAPSALIYAKFTTGNIILGNSVDGTNRDFGGVPGTNILKLINGTRSTGTAIAGGGYFYVTGGFLHWVDQNGIDSQLSESVAGQLASSALTAFTNNAAAALGTLTNAPVAGNPTKWIPINDNGTIRNIPAW